MKHFATDEFWECYEKLPKQIQALADKNYDLLKQDPKHPSLHFQKNREIMVSTGRSSFSGFRNRDRRRHNLVLDWFSCRLR